MKKLLSTLFINSENAYLSLDGENVLVNREKEITARFPLHTLSGIISFSYAGASPALLGACASRGIGLSFCTPHGRFLARVCGESNGNVHLRREQYRIADNDISSCKISRMMVFGKLYNSRWSIDRTLRDHSLRVNSSALHSASGKIKDLLPIVADETEQDTLRGFEGMAANAYFEVFNELILNDDFCFSGRNRRPPRDPVNAMMSFAYSLLSFDCASALESVGLDAYVGFLHRDRPGRRSLSLDLMEELRPCMADRFVLTLINNRIFKPEDFDVSESGAVLLSTEARKTFLRKWQEKKKDELTHPYLNERLQWGMIPYVQALLLSRCLRGDIDDYPPFLWK